MHQQIFERQEPQCPSGAGSATKRSICAGIGNSACKRALVAAAFKLQRQRVAGVGDERERMRRVDGQRRQHRENLVEKHIIEMREIGLWSGPRCAQA